MSAGLGVMLQHLMGGSADWDRAKGRIIASIDVDKSGDGSLRIGFADGSRVVISDDGRSCCESRYLEADGDTFAHYVGATFLDVECKDGGKVEDGCEDHEICFLAVKTDRGEFTLSAHNEHNGYYGGFAIGCTFTEAEATEA